MTTPSNKSGFSIAVSCPACGGELELGDDFFATACEHCGQVLRIVFPETPPAYLTKPKIKSSEARFHVDRYLKENDLPLTDSVTNLRCFLYPYWRVDGILLRLRHRKETKIEYSEATDSETTLEERKIETLLSPYSTTLAARDDTESIPYSLGVRTEYIKLVPFSEEHLPTDALIVPMEVAWQAAVQRASKSVDCLSTISTPDTGVNQTYLLRPVVSMVYFPYLALNATCHGEKRCFVLDGLTGRVVESECNGNIFAQSVGERAQPPKFGKLTVELHRCGNCGEALPATKSYVYSCETCKRVYFLDACQGLNSDMLGVATPNGNSELQFPFWLIDPNGTGNGSRTVIPAFRFANFESMFRLSRKMTTAMPSLKVDSLQGHLNGNLPVGISAGEALALSQVVKMREALGAGIHTNGTNGADHSDSITLLFLPFKPESYFYVDSALNVVTFEKNSVDRALVQQLQCSGNRKKTPQS